MKKLMIQATFALLFATLALTGCADTHSLIRQSPQSSVMLSSSDTFYISLSRDGQYGDESYLGSGLTFSQVVLSSVAQYARRVDVATSAETYETALLSTKAKKYDYLVFPTILHWENHATEWNGVPDRIKVKIEVVKINGESLVDSAIIEGKSGIWTFGGDQPQDLLPIPVEEFISNLFVANTAHKHPPKVQPQRGSA